MLYNAPPPALVSVYECGPPSGTGLHRGNEALFMYMLLVLDC